MMQIGRFWRTVRHLKASQILGRLYFLWIRQCPDLAPAPILATPFAKWQNPGARAASLLGPGEFIFLNETGSVDRHGWDGASKSKLWRYNQHYFDDLNAEGSVARNNLHQLLIEDWIACNPPARGTGWEPYPTSLRIVNWIKWSLSGQALSALALDSLAAQVRWLEKRLEWHLLGNHLFANAKALVFAGLFFSGDEASRWLKKGTAIIRREIPEQILRDGGHFELSTMYHSLILEDMLDLVNIAATYDRKQLSTEWREPIPAMLAWLQNMSHPDGDIAFFNDAAFAIALDKHQLFTYANRLGFSVPVKCSALCYLAESGYVRMDLGPYVLMMDVARVGPDYLPGHAHADTLSIELSYAGQRVFVNSGTSEYSLSEERLRQRGTAAHNTVLVENQNSSEVWSSFRVGRRAVPSGVQVFQEENKLYVVADHNGYRFLTGQPIVKRQVCLSSRLQIVDSIKPIFAAEARYHLHPDVCVENLSFNALDLILADGKRLKAWVEGGVPRLEASSWHPQFGMSLPTLCLILPLADGSATLTLEDDL